MPLPGAVGTDIDRNNFSIGVRSTPTTVRPVELGEFTGMLDN